MASQLLIAEPEIEEIVDTDATVGEGDMQKVLIHNDDVTPMDFVLHVLETMFNVPSPQAEYIMLTAHTKGLALVAILPQSEAQRKVGKAHFAASLEGYPLTFTIEPVE
jgi:ATP-dependent Clp protease adaptor protein ClpS